MTVRLSHSQANKFTDCSKSWYYHYVKRLRKRTTTSALLFGSLIDGAVEVYLDTGDIDKALLRLKESWKVQEINGVPRELFNCPDLVYSNSDFDKDLLEEEDWNELKEKYGDDAYSQYLSTMKQKDIIGFDLLKKEKKILINNFNWFSMLRKGNLMFKKVVEILDEEVEEVLGTQIKVELEDGEGNSIVGYTDFVVRLKGYDKPVILDLKTSSIDYEPDSVKTSQQLSLYLEGLSEDFENTRYAGYLVLHKRIQKHKKKVCKKCGFDGTGKRFKKCNNEIDGERCNGEWDEEITFTVKHQLIVDEISEHVSQMVLENMSHVAQRINNDAIVRNFGACKKPWGKCAYYDLCFSNKKDGLIELEEKE